MDGRARQGERRSAAGWLAVPVALLVVAGAGWNAFGGVPFARGEEEEVRAVLAVLDRFMVAGEREDVPGGQELVAGLLAGGDLTADDVSALFEDERRVFQDYAAVDREQFGIGVRTSWDGTRAELGGEVSYEGAADRPYEAELVKRNGEWRLTSLTFG